jgi:hypothetical protein
VQGPEFKLNTENKIQKAPKTKHLEVETRGLQFEASPGKVSGRPYLKNKLKTK